jgi:outer membrane protein assembly factor BamB
MKHPRQLLFLLVCLCLVIPSGVPKRARAQNSPDDGKKVFDNYTTVTTMVYPPAGASFKVAKEMLDLFGYFGSSVDAVGEAIQRINERLGILERKVTDLEAQVRALNNDLRHSQNLGRVQRLQDKQRALELMLFKLRQRPTERREKLALVKEAELNAGSFLTDPDLWTWSDMREKDGLMLPADFKPLPALEYYVIAVVTWMAAIDYATEGDYGYVKREYGAQLQRHIDRLRVRAGWKEGDEAATLPENIGTRIRCTLEPLSLSPRAGKCAVHEWCEDRLARVLTTVRMHDVPVPRGTEMCNVPATMSARGSEDELERLYGTEVLEKLAEKLELIKTRGTARDDNIGTFDPSTQTAHYLYAVKPDGELLWYRHREVSRKTGAQASEGSDRAMESDGLRARRQPQTAKSSVSGKVRRVKIPDGQETFAKQEVTHLREGPKAVGLGWGDYAQVFSGGGGIIYAMRPDGKLFWYRHNGHPDGRGVDSPGAWEGPKEVGSHWDQFKRIIPGGDGVIYVVSREDNRLKWFRHINYAMGAKSWEEPPKDVGGPMWGDYKHVFSTGGGVLYAVTEEGQLLWYRNNNYLQGAKSWEGPKVVGSGWQDFKDVFSAGEGVIYAVTEDGRLLWYEHEGYRDGSTSWRGPATIAADWTDFRFIFANMSAAWTPPIVR